ncbi:HIT family protein [[Mycoplasma] testudinis]|uniref:HIT family protein n=1 Tax=[Mycoplasma] testudinis TaxID=33924 RepID=UPI000569D014|nr:HIT family protein [[Mycoplasma] testudinis]
MLQQDDCIFCKIVKKEIPAMIIGETDQALAFLDVNPTADGHTIVIPKEHYRNLSITPWPILDEVMHLTSATATKLMKSQLDPWGINYLSNEGNVAGQEVFHFHFHVIPKYAQGEGFGFNTKKVNLQKIEQVHKMLDH